jgi:hypothetical protein
MMKLPTFEALPVLSMCMNRREVAFVLMEVRQHTLIFIQFALPVRVGPTSFDFVLGS